MNRFLIGFALSVLVATGGYLRKALSKNGAAGAVLVGTAIVGAAGWDWGALLVLFFVTSSALSRFQEARKAAAAAEKFSKGAQRDLGQVLANGGVGALAAMAFYLLQAEWLWAAFVGAMATVTADTWATELGVLSRALPRLITNGRRVEAGTSGGVSWRGSLAALGGSALIGAGAVVFGRLAGQPRGVAPTWVAAIIGGLFGSFFDSLLGATVQRIYFCPACNKETERHPLHHCGTTTVPLRGWSWLNNDWVNFLSSAVGAGVAAPLWVWLATSR